jgi:hypothetical protein
VAQDRVPTLELSGFSAPASLPPWCSRTMGFKHAGAGRASLPMLYPPPPCSFSLPDRLSPVFPRRFRLRKAAAVGSLTKQAISLDLAPAQVARPREATAAEALAKAIIFIC